MKNFLLFFFLFELVGCTHKEASFVPENLCDSTQVDYSNNIKPIIINNCYSCHSGNATASGGLNLEDSQSLKNYLTLDFRGDGIYGSKLFHALKHSVNSIQMPPTYILDTCSLDKIHYLLSLGAPLN